MYTCTAQKGIRIRGWVIASQMDATFIFPVDYRSQNIQHQIFCVLASLKCMQCNLQYIELDNRKCEAKLWMVSPRVISPVHFSFSSSRPIQRFWLYLRLQIILFIHLWWNFFQYFHFITFVVEDILLLFCCNQFVY